MTREELEKRRKTIDVLREMDSLLILLQGVLDELRYMNDKDE